jgi:hypothetical protein
MSKGGTRPEDRSPGVGSPGPAAVPPDWQIRPAQGMAAGEAKGSLLTRTRLEGRPEKPLARRVPTVPHTDTGRRVEDTQARERTLVKELGKLTP